MNYLCRRFGLDSARWRDAELAGGLYEKMRWLFCRRNCRGFTPQTIRPSCRGGPGFPDGGVLIWPSRNRRDSSICRGHQGGNNGVSHGHNDVGSFSVVAGKTMVVCDRGW